MAGNDLAYQMSFSGQDAEVYAYIMSSGGENSTGVLSLSSSIQTLSVSVYREKVPVRSLGYSNVVGHTRGPRTIAGSMIFTILHDHPLKTLFKDPYYDFSYDSNYIGRDLGTEDYFFPDAIPPFNLMIVYNNELGYSSIMHILGVDLISDGITTSVEDMMTENTYQYRARDLRVFKAQIGANLDGVFSALDVEREINFLSQNVKSQSSIYIPETQQISTTFENGEVKTTVSTPNKPYNK